MDLAHHSFCGERWYDIEYRDCLVLWIAQGIRHDDRSNLWNPMLSDGNGVLGQASYDDVTLV